MAPDDRIGELVAELEAAPPSAVRDTAQELLSAVMELHRDGLSRMLEAIRRGGLPENALAELSADDAVAKLLLLHDLHPESVSVRVERALEKVRPALGAHRGNVELIAIEGGTLRLKLTGTCHGCPSSASTIRGLIETAVLDAAPELERIEVDGAVQ